MGDLDPFKRIVRDAQSDLVAQLAKGDVNPYVIMITREAIDIATRQLTDTPDVPLTFNTVDRRRAGGRTPAQLWFYGMVWQQAVYARTPAVADPVKYRLKRNEYQQKAEWLVKHINELVMYGRKVVAQDRIYIIHETKQTRDVVTQIALALARSADLHQYDRDFLQVSVDDALQRMLRDERFDLEVALRIASEVPGDITVWSLEKPEQRPAYVDAVEFFVTCIPVVGEGVMAYEAVLGQDLFGYDLSGVERGVLAVGALLPMAARFVEGSHAAYSAERMTHLYGGEEKTWENSLALSEQVAAENGSFKTLEAARESVAVGRSVPPAIATEIGDLLTAIGIAKADRGVPTVLSKIATDTFDRLVASNARWAEIDANALERILKKKRRSAIKGQLFEEVLENRLALWLADPAGKSALGLEHVAGRLEFIPGHSITSLSGRQLTDGLLVERIGAGRYRIWAVFEAKSGAEAARGLSRTPVSLSRMSKAEKAQLRAEAEEAMEILKERKRLTGTPITMTIDDIMNEIAEESGGQVRRDIERLYANEAGGRGTAIFIGGAQVDVELSPKFTQFFGVVPSDVSLSTVAQELRDQGISNFIALGINYTQQELKTAADVVASALGLTK